MKLIKSFFVLILVILSGCSSSSDDGVILPPSYGPDYILVAADKTIFEVGETVTFVVTDDQDEDITSKSTILIEGTAIEGNTFSPVSSGNYEVKATYQSVTSNKLFIRANPPVVLSALDVSLSEPAVFKGGVVTFSASAVYSDHTKVDVTSESQFYVDDTPISGNEYTGLQVGTVEVSAEYETVASSLFQVHIVDPSNLPESFSKKAVVEDFTGTWCGYCPRVSYAASLVEAQTDKVFIVGVHNGDEMANNFGSSLEDEYNITGFPTAYIDRSTVWSYPEPNNVNQAINAAQGTTNVGLAIESTLNGSNLEMTITTGFLENVTEGRLVVFVLEDGILSNQVNYTSYYGGASTLVNFEHNGVLRYSVTDVLGDPTTSILGIHVEDFSVDLSSYGVQDVSKTGILAMLADDSGRVLLNAQYAHVDQTQDFD